MSEPTKQQLDDAVNLLCSYAIGRLPDGYDIHLAVDRDEAELRLEDSRGNDVELDEPSFKTLVDFATEHSNNQSDYYDADYYGEAAAQ